AYLQAKKSYPVSADASWRYGNFLLREGQQAQAYAELRRAMEADPKRAAAAFSRAYRSNPNIDELLGQLLPPIQSVYVDVIWEALSAKQLAVAKTVWAQLVTLHPHLQMRDVDHFVSELLQAGEFAEARQVWDQGVSTMNLPPLLQPQSSVVWDPSFETGFNGFSFSWHYPAIVQPSTTYRFSGWIKTKSITSDEGIGFRLRAVDGTAPVVNTQQMIGTNPWTLVEQSWTSGANVHRMQICVTRDASENPEVRISGNAWVDDVNLLPQPAEHHKP